MKQIVKCKLMALGISLVFAACNSGDKTTESATTNTDTTEQKTTMAESTPQEQVMDAAKVAPALYKVVKDTMGIRVLDILYKPGDSSAMHSHPDNVLYVIDGGKGVFTEKDGTKHVNEFKNGMSMILGPGTHSVKNVGTTTLKAILVEVNRPNTKVEQDQAMDPLKVAPALYKVVSDSLNIRVLMATYKPGASSALHSHPDNAIYVIGGSKAEFTMKDGTKQVMTMDKGMTSIFPGGVHSVKNIGNTTTKVLIVEVNRPVN